MGVDNVAAVTLVGFNIKTDRILVGAIGISARHEGVLVAIHVGNLRQDNVLEGISPSLLILAKELSELAASIGAKTIEMPTVCQGQCVRLSARDRHHLLVLQGDDFGRERLVWLAIGVLQEVFGIVKSQLAVGCFSPRVDDALSGQGHRVRVSTG